MSNGRKAFEKASTGVPSQFDGELLLHKAGRVPAYPYFGYFFNSSVEEIRTKCAIKIKYISVGVHRYFIPMGICLHMVGTVALVPSSFTKDRCQGKPLGR